MEPRRKAETVTVFRILVFTTVFVTIWCLLWRSYVQRPNANGLLDDMMINNLPMTHFELTSPQNL